MTSTLIVYEKNPLSKFFFKSHFKKIYEENFFYNQDFKNKNKIFIDQFFDAKKGKKSDYKISKHIDKIFSKIIKNKSYNGKDDDLISASNTYKQKIALYASEINKAFSFAGYIKKKFNIRGKIYLETKFYNNEVYKIMKDLNLLDKNIQILTEVRFFNYFYNKIKNLFFFINILFLPEISLFKCKFRRKKIIKYKKKISFFINDENLDKNNLSSFFLKDKNFKNKIIFISKKPLKNIKIKNVEYFNNKIFKNFDFFYFLKSFYSYLRKKRVSFLFYSMSNPIFSNVLYKTFEEIVYWKMLLQLYDINYHITPMSDEKIFKKKFLNQNGIKTIFIYYSSTEEIIKWKILKSFTRVNYAYLNYDYFVSDNISIKLFKNQKTLIKDYVQIGSIGSDLILENNKLQIIKKNKFKNNLVNKVTISFFDHSIGRDGIWNQKDYNNFLKSIYLLLFSFNYNIVLKTKKSKHEIKSNFSKENQILFSKIEKYNNFHHIGGYSKKLGIYGLIALSDLIISAPVSSIISEALGAKKKLIVFDPNSKYIGSVFSNKKIKNIYCNDIKNFMKIFKSNLKINSKKYENYIHNSFIKNISGLDNFGSNKKNFIKIIK